MTDHGGVPQDHPDVDAEAYRLRVVDRLTFSEIGARYGITAQAAHQRYKRVAESLPPIDIAAIRAEALAGLTEIMREAMAVARMNGAPVFVGKDGTIAREPAAEGEIQGAVVRDYAGKINALRLVGWSIESIRKLAGADAASKVESTSTVKYSIEGVDLDGLK